MKEKKESFMDIANSDDEIEVINEGSNSTEVVSDNEVEVDNKVETPTEVVKENSKKEKGKKNKVKNKRKLSFLSPIVTIGISVGISLSLPILIPEIQSNNIGQLESEKFKVEINEKFSESTLNNSEFKSDVELSVSKVLKESSKMITDLGDDVDANLLLINNEMEAINIEVRRISNIVEGMKSKGDENLELLSKIKKAEGNIETSKEKIYRLEVKIRNLITEGNNKKSIIQKHKKEEKKKEAKKSTEIKKLGNRSLDSVIIYGDVYVALLSNKDNEMTQALVGDVLDGNFEITKIKSNSILFLNIKEDKEYEVFTK